MAGSHFGHFGGRQSFGSFLWQAVILVILVEGSHFGGGQSFWWRAVILGLVAGSHFGGGQSFWRRAVACSELTVWRVV